MLLPQMAQLSGSHNRGMKSENDSLWSSLDDQQDAIPLKQRLKKLLRGKSLSDMGETIESKNLLTPPVDIVVKENEQSESQGFNFSCIGGEGRIERLFLKGTHDGELGEYNSGHMEPKKCVASNTIKLPVVNASMIGVEKHCPNDASLLQYSMLPKYPVNVKVEFTDENLMSSSRNCLSGSSGADAEDARVKNEVTDDFLNGLDHIVLKKRRSMLLSRKLLGLAKPVLQGNSSGCSYFVDDVIQYSVGIGQRKSDLGERESSMVGNPYYGNLRTLESGSSKGAIARPSPMISRSPSLAIQCHGTESTKPGDFTTKENDKIWSYTKSSTQSEYCGVQCPLSSNCMTMLTSALPTFINVKAEPLDNYELHIPNEIDVELELPGELYGDRVDHMSLRERMKLLALREFPSLDTSGNFQCSQKFVPSFLDYRPIVSESAKPLRFNRPRKWRKTVTVSVETALEEDAPGLLQLLIDQGVSIHGIKLYGESESEDALDDSSTEHSFTELEAMISKLFSKRQSLLKFGPIRWSKGEKTSYCLACLISLVEQAHYLMFRKWPVEWGWCRDLQLFIFVFERHNRIVLERPEYGYATYFFELVDSLPIDWQIRRLVTAMKLTSCSRVTLIENKALVVGEDLTKGEAQVLLQYGWIPNSGLGTMLNYCDRVVHDRKNEDSSEWRLKIGKLLMDGYNGGTIVSTDIPRKVVEYGITQNPEIKLEL